ncbi:hypothetical protein VP1G_10663 [Cytospora mali]|uniref:Uncharacterized protein n=1 Tax=Cytospora mali TaxID=578113 RepID=A0A194US92_CYTMA|nr:hypothetical protein VP1G_10663 [Valsa mali var. pyri (nom. inval.)]
MDDPSHKLDVLATPVVAEWVDTDGRTRYLSTGWIMNMVKETDAQIGVLVDENLTSAKLELQDFVTDRLRSTSAEIVQRLRDAEVYLDIRLESP